MPLSGSAGLTGTSYWFNVFQLDTVEKVHEYLERLPERGKVLSLATAMELVKQGPKAGRWTTSVSPWFTHACRTP